VRTVIVRSSEKNREGDMAILWKGKR